MEENAPKLRYIDLSLEEIFETQEEADKFMDSYEEAVNRITEVIDKEDRGSFALILLFQHYTNNKAVYKRFDALFERLKQDSKPLEIEDGSM